MHCVRKVISSASLCTLLAGFSTSSLAVPLVQPSSPPITKTQNLSARPNSPSPTHSWYIDVSGGLSAPEDSDVINSASSNEFSYDNGFSFSAALGYRPEAKHSALGYMRFEGAIGYQQAELNNDGVSPSTGTTGNTYTYTAMLNGYYDFKNATNFVPYVGAGFGIARVSLEDITRVNISDESDILPAYQLMAGFSIEPESLPYTALHLGYRYFTTFGDAEFSDSTGAIIKARQGSHNLEGGMRWHF